MKRKKLLKVVLANIYPLIVFFVVTNANMYKTRQYKIWQWIKERCKVLDNDRCRNYWFRGITYDEKWKTFKWFWEDMENWYADNLSIDRIDNDWNYYKENCRWTTKTEQARNRRSNYMIWDITLKQYCMVKWFNYKRVHARLKLGWSQERAFTKLDCRWWERERGTDGKFIRNAETSLF